MTSQASSRKSGRIPAEAGLKGTELMHSADSTDFSRDAEFSRAESWSETSRPEASTQVMTEVATSETTGTRDLETAEAPSTVQTEASPAQGVASGASGGQAVVPVEQADDGPGESVELEGARILVVDDEEVIRMLLTDILTDDGHEVESVPCGEDAVVRLKDYACDIVVTDLMMPGINGVKVLEAAKEGDPDVEVLVMTGYASLDTAVECMKLGAADYLHKPLNIDEIRITITRLLEKKRLQAKAKELDFYKELSRTDGLTQLYNHKFFHQLLSGEVGRVHRYGGNVSLLMLDVDHFKIYNDTNGHPTGDTALQRVARILREGVRASDSVSRYGGEEFTVISPQVAHEGAAELGERLRERVERTQFESEDVMPQGRLTVSIGFAVFPDDADDKTMLIERADRALYRAKEGGRNRVVAWTDIADASDAGTSPDRS